MWGSCYKFEIILLLIFVFFPLHQRNIQYLKCLMCYLTTCRWSKFSYHRACNARHTFVKVLMNMKPFIVFGRDCSEFPKKTRDIAVLRELMWPTSGTTLLGKQWPLFTNMDWILIPAWINKYTHDKLWDEIAYPFRNVNGAIVDVCEWICNSNSHFTAHLITYPCWY